ncbi:MAG: zinc-ribbon domain-containing protein [Candidatus Cloacimonetes bacterium]|nr:zinc-ribbon domain-containing protein [Candidatus Cloacimonadota bacterium]
MKCKNCYANLSDNAKFCNQCGSHVAENQKCRNCGHVNKLGAKYCGECGSILETIDLHSEVSQFAATPSYSDSAEFRSHEYVKPPYWVAILLIILGTFTLTIVPAIFGVLSLIKCSEASKANSRGDYEEARKLAKQAIRNPLGLSVSASWIIAIIFFLIAAVLFYLTSGY